MHDPKTSARRLLERGHTFETAQATLAQALHLAPDAAQKVITEIRHDLAIEGASLDVLAELMLNLRQRAFNIEVLG